VRHDGRANPRQLIMNDASMGEIAALRDTLLAAHTDPQAENGPGPLVIGLQLTHSGRFCRPGPGHGLAPIILYRHPILDRKFGLADDHPLMTDDDIERLIEDFVAAAVRAQRCGFDFIDLKHCHGYLGHEFLSAVHRPGRFGGSLENRTRFLREIVAGVRAEAPGLTIGVRLSAIDLVPFRPDPTLSTATALGPGVPEPFTAPYDQVFGAHPGQPTEPDIAPGIAFCTVLEQLGITLLNVTAGSPYYNPHVTRPALYPPSDGYRPPEEPLAGVLRLLHATQALKQRFPTMVVVGSGYTYLQEFLPHVGQAALRQGWTDFVGLGRMVLSYPELPRDVLRDGAMKKKRLCWRGAWIGTSNISGLGSVKNAFGVGIGMVHIATNATRPLIANSYHLRLTDGNAKQLKLFKNLPELQCRSMHHAGLRSSRSSSCLRSRQHRC